MVGIRGGIGTGRDLAFSGNRQGRLQSSPVFCKVRGFWAFPTGRIDNWGDSSLTRSQRRRRTCCPSLLNGLSSRSGHANREEPGRCRRWLRRYPPIPRGVRGFQPSSSAPKVRCFCLKHSERRMKAKPSNSPPLGKGGQGGSQNLHAKAVKLAHEEIRAGAFLSSVDTSRQTPPTPPCQGERRGAFRPRFVGSRLWVAGEACTMG